MKMKTTWFAAMAALSASLSSTHAQQTWDPVSGDAAITHTNGVWDTSTANWTANGGINNAPWSNGGNALFSTNLAKNAVTIDVAAGVQVGDLALAGPNGGGQVTLRGQADNNVLSLASGGATWELGGRTLALLADTANDLSLNMASGDTLTVTSTTGTGGVFNTGEKPTGAPWSAAGATLDFQAGTLRGNNESVGAFSLVKLVGGSSYIHERNSNQTYANNWELGPGIVTFSTRYGGNGDMTMNGIISGAGTLNLKNSNTRFLRLGNTNNTFSGGIIVDSQTTRSELNVTQGDGCFGAVPVSFDPDNLTLRNSGELKINGITINANRGITLDNGGIIVLLSNPSTYGGKITGTGGLQIGRPEGADANKFILASNTSDYTGGTRIHRGTLQLGTDNALPANTVVTIGGTGTSVLELNGFDLTIGGLTTAAANTRRVDNNGGGTIATLTVEVAEGEDFNYGSNISGTDPIHIVKEGLGTQRFDRSGTYSTPPASLTVNDGFLAWDSGSGPTGLTTVNSGGTLGGTGAFTTNVVLESGASIAPGNPGGQNALSFGTVIDLSAMASDNAGGFEFSFATNNFDRIVATNLAANGTINFDGSETFDLGFADFTFIDVNGVASGVYTIMVADVISGTLNPADLSGAVGGLGATGALSLSGDGKAILLTIDGADTSAYGQWAAAYDLSGGETDDDDSDGWLNFEEFAFGGNPTNAANAGYAPASSVATLGGTNYLRYVYGYRTNVNSGVSYTFETTPNLVYSPWTNANYVVLGTTMADAGFAIQTNGIPTAAHPAYFGRLQLEKQ